MDRVGEGCVFGQLFKGGCGIVVVHALHCSAAEWNYWALDPECSIVSGQSWRRMPATAESGFFGIDLAEHRFYRGCQASGTLIEFQSGFLEVGGGAFVGSP